MATQSNEIRSYFGRCRCCLEYGYLKNMWTVHHWEGESEIYGEMMTQCFAFSLEQIKGVDKDQLCATCITRLRDACNFKYMIIRSQRLLMQEDVCEGDSLNFKLEPVKPENSFDSDTGDDTKDVPEVVEEMEIIQMDEKAPAEEHSYEDVEYLEEEIVTEKVVEEPEVSDSKLEESDESAPRKPKWPKKLPRNERNKRYLQYTEEDLRKSIEAVKSKKMSRIEAAQYYNVPQKTLTAKLRQHSESGEINPDREERYKFLTEIKTILTFTNGTPFKTRMNRYCCAYCSDVCFNDPVELRNHTRTTHMDDRTKKVDLMMRPYFMNEILKLDIENLLCVVCCTPIYKWNNLFHHLKDKHQIELDLAYRKVIPFTLDVDLKCALCSEPYINYMQLDGHMNSHYNNYVCGDCGDTFLTTPRLKSHMKIHMTGKYPCNHCEKVFKLEHYKKKHEAVVHKISLYYKCTHCGMKFGSERERKNHVTEIHRDKVKIITCEQCGKTFNWRHYFISHLRKSHSERKHECPHCDKRFVDKADLDAHVAAKHDGEKKYQCLSCNKRYSSRPGLIMHLKAHRNCAEATEMEYILNS